MVGGCKVAKFNSIFFSGFSSRGFTGMNMRKSILNEKGLNHITVQHDVEILGNSGQWHQVDVYWKYEHQGHTTCMALECKNYSNPIEIGIVKEVIGLRTDVPDLQVAIVTKKGYQKGAIILAKYHKIGLRLVREALNTDYEGRARKITLIASSREKEFLIQMPMVDSNWLKENFTEDQIRAIDKGFLASTDSVFVNDYNANTRFSFLDLENQISYPPIFQEEPGKEYEYTFEWENAFLEAPNYPLLKIEGLYFKYRYQVSTREIIIGAISIAHTLVKDILENRSLFIDENGEITGDKETLPDN